MCTIALLHQLREDHSLVVAANRDEFYARPATPPQVLDPHTGAIGGLDHKGGTWMGLSQAGLFVGLTNQRTHLPPPENARSRGEVVRAALSATSFDEALGALFEIDPSEYPPFNLVLGDGRELVVLYARPDGIEHVPLEPGLYVLANDRLDSPLFPKTERFAQRIRPWIDSPWPELSRALREALGDTSLPEAHLLPDDPDSPLPAPWRHALQALCIHTPGYGTCSSTLAALGEDGPHAYHFAHGAPDQVPFTDLTALLARA
ncbi:MAG: NRDE family protein [Deltaproteobacteria bacterium]|nr:NRDE family protein [Deltaproteobacteria bacterium]